MPVPTSIKFHSDMAGPNVEVGDGPVTGLASEGIHVVRTPVGSVRRGVFFVPEHGCLFVDGVDYHNRRLFLYPRSATRLFAHGERMSVYVDLVLRHDVAASDIRGPEPIEMQNLGVASVLGS